MGTLNYGLWSWSIKKKKKMSLKRFRQPTNHRRNHMDRRLRARCFRACLISPAPCLTLQVRFTRLFIKTKLSQRHFFKSRTITVITTEYAECHMPLLWMQYQTVQMGAQWLSGRVLDSRPKGRGFEPHRRHCVVVLEQDTFILV